MYRPSGLADMSEALFTIRPERPEDEAAIECLLDREFGVQRTQKTAYRLRARGRPVNGLSFVAFAEQRLVGTVQMWPLRIGTFEKALLLGPLAVSRAFSGNRCGITLMETALGEARRLGWLIVVLVGDEPYYAKVGFRRVPPGRLVMPGPVDPDRLLVCELEDGAFDGLEGLLEPGAG